MARYRNVFESLFDYYCNRRQIIYTLIDDTFRVEREGGTRKLKETFFEFGYFFTVSVKIATLNGSGYV